MTIFDVHGTLSDNKQLVIVDNLAQSVGENCSTQLVIAIPDNLSDYNYYIELSCPSGRLVMSPVLTAQDNVISYTLGGSIFEQEGRVWVQISARDADDERVVFKSRRDILATMQVHSSIVGMYSSYDTSDFFTMVTSTQQNLDQLVADVYDLVQQATADTQQCASLVAELQEIAESDEMKGEQGDAFTYADFTDEQLASLKGDTGEQGIQGIQGDAFTYDDFTAEQLLALKGAKGDTGDAFTYADFTDEQLASLKGATGDTGAKGDTGDAFTYEDFTVSQLEALKGDAFTYGDFTVAQLESLKGATGDTGAKGDTGDAFTYDDFTDEQLASLKGEQGDAFTYSDFTSEQLAGLKGDTGDAFTYADFTDEQLAGLKGEQGDAFTYEDFTTEQLAGLKGEQGDAFTYEDFTTEQLQALQTSSDFVADNIIVNSRFAINSRGLTSYVASSSSSKTYCMDNWYIAENSSDVTVVPSSSGVTISNSGSATGYLCTRSELAYSLSGKQATFSCSIDDTIYSATTDYYDSSLVLTTDDMTITVSQDASSNIVTTSLAVPTGTSGMVVNWVKLEQGEQTRYQYEDMSIEHIRCARYLQMFPADSLLGTGYDNTVTTYIAIPVMVPMASVPTCTGTVCYRTDTTTVSYGTLTIAQTTNMALASLTAQLQETAAVVDPDVFFPEEELSGISNIGIVTVESTALILSCEL